MERLWEWTMGDPAEIRKAEKVFLRRRYSSWRLNKEHEGASNAKGSGGFSKVREQPEKENTLVPPRNRGRPAGWSAVRRAGWPVVMAAARSCRPSIVTLVGSLHFAPSIEGSHWRSVNSGETLFMFLNNLFGFYVKKWIGKGTRMKEEPVGRLLQWSIWELSFPGFTH